MMLKIRYLLIISLLLCDTLEPVRAQIDSVIVETYYVAGGVDTTSFYLAEPLKDGSVTYRVYLDLEEGAKLLEIYGDENHPFIVSSTAPFFNNTFRGQSFGFKNSEQSFMFNTVALDTWLTLGLVTRDHMGILKTEDPDGAVEPILNNGDGVLKNDDPLAKPPVTLADGMVPAGSGLAIAHAGITDIITGEDSSIFGVNGEKNTFYSHAFSLRDANGEGIVGPNSGNRILLCQLTTLGEISFTLNAKIRNRDGNIVRYIGMDTLIDAENDEILNSWLKYPFDLNLGCMDPYYAEYDPTAVIDDGSCREPAIFGCLDTAACNYNPDANVHLEELCCFNSDCELDLDMVCKGTIYGCMDPEAANYNPEANATSDHDACCYRQGCMDKNFVEYDRYACYQDSTDCKLLIVKGCMDKSACNYNPVANSPAGCDYSSCSAEDLRKSFTIPGNQRSGSYTLNLYPNPVDNNLFLEITISDDASVSFEIWNSMGQLMVRNIKNTITGSQIHELDLSGINTGVYLLKVRIHDAISIVRILKY